MPINKTKPVQGQFVGPRMLVVDTPESFQKPDVLGSTISATPGRGGERLLFQGQGDVFALANNRTGKPQRFQVAVYNPSDKPMTVTYSGTVYSQHVTKTDGKIPSGYAEGRFGGPHAIVGRAHLEAVNGRNGYQTTTVTIPPRSSGVLVDQYQEAGGEVFARGTLTARTPDGKPARFGTAVVAMPQKLDADQLRQLTAGALPAAGVPSDFAPADERRLGRPNGVTTGGGTFQGGRTLDISTPGNTADLVMATRRKNAGSTAEVAKLTNVPGNLRGPVPRPPRTRATSASATCSTTRSTIPPSRTARCRCCSPRRRPSRMRSMARWAAKCPCPCASTATSSTCAWTTGAMACRSPISRSPRASRRR